MIQKRIYGYFERNPWLRVLFIFDRMAVIQTELDEVREWAGGYVYKVFDGAWFNAKYAIENTWKDKRVILLFRQEICPVTERQQLDFPLLDILRANMEYKEEDYAEFMQRYGLPEKYSAFVKRNIGEITSARVSGILSGHLTADTFSEDAVCRALISGYMGERRLLDWESIIVRMIILGGGEDGKRRADFFLRMERNPDARRMLTDRLTCWFGRSYSPNSGAKMKPVAESMKYNGITQLLEARPADNYRGYKVTSASALDWINRIYELGSNDGRLSGRFTMALAELSSDIREEEIVRVYGTGARYFRVTDALCWPILEDIVRNRLTADPAEVSDRMRELRMKLPPDSAACPAVRFIEQAALYYGKVRGFGTLRLNTPEEYVRKYVAEFYQADLLYRHALEEYHELMTREVPVEAVINEAKRRLDQDYAKFANVMNLEWLSCVKERNEAFGGIAIGRQENFYDNEACAKTKQVIIVSDSLRYEVAQELMHRLAREKHPASIAPCLAMLPTETKYCKPSLFPHRTLELHGTDMEVDGARLITTDQRTAHLDKYRAGAVCVRYEDVMNGETAAMRGLFKHPLVYVFHDTIDEASHSQNPFEVIAACRKAIDQLSVLVKKLHSSWNVGNVLITADHGFIYNDMKFEEKDKHVITDESAVEKKARYYLTTSGSGAEGIAKFAVEKVSGITAPGMFVAVPLGTNRLAAPGGYSFAHGGASLQEMIVPVIRSRQCRTGKIRKVGADLADHDLTMVSSRLKFTIYQTEAVSMAAMERKIICLIFLGDEALSAGKELTLDSTDTAVGGRLYEVTMSLGKSVTDSMLELRVYDADDTSMLNPLIRETIKNNTIIEQDF